MAVKPFDPTLKALVDTEPESWPTLLDYPPGPAAVVDADIATVTGAADKVLRVGATPPYLLHLEFVSGHDAAALPRKLHLRNGLLGARHRLRVRSAVVLLRPQADSPRVSGVYRLRFPGEKPYLRFRYSAVRVWELPPGPLLRGGLPLLALAPISAVTEAELPGIIQQMGRRLKGRRARGQAPVVWAAAYVLLGLRYSPELAAQLFQGVVSMKESSTYQAILEEGRAKGRTEGAVVARKLLRAAGDRALGAPDAQTAQAIDRIEDLGRLEELSQRLPTAGSWQELLGRPAPTRGRGRRQSP